MDPAPKPTLAVPNYRATKTLGTLNIVFATLIILMGICGSVYMAFLPSMGRAMDSMQKQLAQQVEEQKKRQLDDLEEREKKAETEAEKEAIKQQKQQVASAKFAGPPTMDFNKMGFTSPEFVRYYWVDLVTMLILNVAMIVSGVRLCRYQESGRKLGLWVAGLKIPRLFLLNVYVVVAIVPKMSRGMAEMAVSMVSQQPGAGAPGRMPGIQEFTNIYGVFNTIAYLAVAVLGSIYPAICLWVLTRPGVRAACSNPDLDPDLPHAPTKPTGAPIEELP